jgi:hypothetical protein
MLRVELKSCRDIRSKTMRNDGCQYFAHIFFIYYLQINY